MTVSRLRPVSLIALLTLAACTDDDAIAPKVNGSWRIESDERTVTLTARGVTERTSAVYEGGELVLSFDDDGVFREEGLASYTYENRVDGRLTAEGTRELSFAASGAYSVEGERIFVTISTQSSATPYDFVRDLRYELDGDRLTLVERVEDVTVERTDTALRTVEVQRQLRRRRP